MDAQLVAVGEAALDRFIETFNARDPGAWAASLSYPHVRVSPSASASTVSPTEQHYAANVSYERADEMGWDHSEWDTKQVLAVSPGKIHASAQWCRFDGDGRRILPNNVSYVVTLVDGRWGIQARFGVDSPPPDRPAAIAARATEALAGLWAAVANDDLDELERRVRLPLVRVGVGTVDHLGSPAEVIGALAPVVSRFAATDMTRLQVGRRGVNLGVTLAHRSPDNGGAGAGVTGAADQGGGTGADGPEPAGHGLCLVTIDADADADAGAGARVAGLSLVGA